MTHCVFEYLYRDAGNFKAWGALLLEGELSEDDIARMTARFDEGMLFVAEQICVPALCETLWRECQCDPSAEMDHVWHEFNAIRAATTEDLAHLATWGAAVELLARVEKVDAWDLTLSPNWEL